MSLPQDAFPKYRKLVDRVIEQVKNEAKDDSGSEIESVASDLDDDLETDPKTDPRSNPNPKPKSNQKSDKDADADAEMPDYADTESESDADMLDVPEHPNIPGVNTTSGKVVAIISKCTLNAFKRDLVTKAFKAIIWDLKKLIPCPLLITMSSRR